jgi:hypothetical protein
MPYFCTCGADEYVCQECGKVRCSKEQPLKRMTVKRMGREGNVCPDCVEAANDYTERDEEDYYAEFKSVKWGKDYERYEIGDI